MLGTIWTTILVNPLLNILMGFYKLTGSLGISIILFTLLIKTILIPVMLPSMKAMKKQRDIQPELQKLKEKYKYDKKKQAEMQMQLFKQHGINPASGCGTQIIMMMVLIALYGVIRTFTIDVDIANINGRIYFDFLKLLADQTIGTKFLYLDLSKPDPMFILAILSGAFQFVASKMTMPYVDKEVKAAEKTPQKSDDIGANMQQQMLYTMPLMNLIIGITLPSGVVLYILVSTIFTVVQTYLFSGWGGMKPIINRVRKIIKK